jgi:flagellar basal body-associated protein FliL
VELIMMNGMMDGGSMMWAMGLVSILVIIVLILAAAALIKYLFFSGQKKDRR